VLKERYPEAPEFPALPDLTLIDPEEVALPTPERMLMLPPE
jgi:hypothetical protein